MIVEAPDGKTIDFGDLPQEQVQSAMSKMYPVQPTKEQPKGLFDKIGQDYDKRVSIAQGIADKGAMGQKNTPETIAEMALTGGGGLLNDIAGEVTGSAANFLGRGITPKEKELVSKAYDYVAKSPVGNAVKSGAQYVGEKYQQIPERGRAVLDAAGNALGVATTFLPTKAAVNAGTSVLESGLQKAGNALISSADDAVKAKRFEQASKAILPDVATVSGRKQAIEEGGVGVKKTLIGKGEAYAKPDKMQEQAIKELVDVEGFDPKALHIDNANAVDNAIGKEAESLKRALEKENVSLLTNERTDLPKTIDDFGGVLNHQPINVPSANKFHDVLDKAVSAISSNETLSGNARATASRIASKMKEFVDANPQTTAGLLQARKDFDKWVKEARSGQKALEPDFENGLSAAARVVRDTTNDFISANTSSADVKASLAKQSALFRARDALEEKARKQAFTRGERAADAIDKYAHLKGVGAKGAGLLATGGAAYLAPQVTIPAISLYALGKGFTSNPVKKAVGKTLTFSSKERQLADIIKRSK